MILHVTFSDGSNPWVSLPADRQTIAKLWRKWMKNHPDTARPVAYCGNWVCYLDGFGDYVVILHRTMTRLKDVKRYKHLGHALAALERLGGDSR